MLYTQLYADKMSNSSTASFVRLPLLGKRPVNVGLMQRNAVRAAFTAVIVFIDYMLMLVVMTFNVALICAAVGGFALGALLFGHLGEPKPRDKMIQPAMGTSPSDADDGLDVHFVDTSSCCNNNV